MSIEIYNTLALIKEADTATFKALLCGMVERAGGATPLTQMVQVVTAQSDNSNPFAEGIVSADKLPEPEDPVRIWFGMYPRSVILFIGETGVGKSSLIYNICIHAARNEPLFGIPFGMGRPARILYIDPENNGNLCSLKIRRIDQGKPKDLMFHHGQGVNLKKPQHIEALKQVIEQHKLDIVVLDPIANLFGTKDENDNAEAAEQMKMLVALSRETGVCIIAVHHTGKSSQGDDGRGASARRGAADVALMFRAKSDAEETDDTFNSEPRQRRDQCRLQIVKNRVEGKGSLYLQMEGEDNFSVSTFENWKASRQIDADGKPVPKPKQAKEEIATLLADNLWHSRKHISDCLRKAEGIGRDAVDAALKMLEEENKLRSEKRANGALYYTLADTAQTTEIQLPDLEIPIGDQETRKLESAQFPGFRPAIGNQETGKDKPEESEALRSFFYDPTKDPLSDEYVE